jgi:hypothetical protein
MKMTLRKPMNKGDCRNKEKAKFEVHVRDNFDIR